jgi:hypothetical protein
MTEKFLIGLLVLACGYLTWETAKFKSDQRVLLRDIESKIATNTKVNSGREYAEQQVGSEYRFEMDNRLSDIEKLLSRLADELQHVKAQQQAVANSARSNVPRINSGQTENTGTQTDEASHQERLSLLNDIMIDTREDDLTWSTSTMTMIEETINSNPVLSAADSSLIDCAAAICRIETTVPASLDAFKQLEFQWTMLMALGKELPTSSYQIENLSDGSQRLVLFMGRKGYQLPRVVAK